jgi:hypothetical protein
LQVFNQQEQRFLSGEISQLRECFSENGKKKRENICDFEGLLPPFFEIKIIIM